MDNPILDIWSILILKWQNWISPKLFSQKKKKYQYPIKLQTKGIPPTLICDLFDQKMRQDYKTMDTYTVHVCMLAVLDEMVRKDHVKQL